MSATTRKFNPSYRTLLRQSFSLLPKDIRFEYFRRAIRFVPHPSPYFEFRVARTKRELEIAFRILHDAYVREGFMSPHPSGMRITLYHALPSTSTLIALWRNEPVGTVSIIRDSALGFPLEKIFQLGELRHQGTRLGEVSALAIRKDFRGNHGEVLFPLLAFLTQYAIRYFGIDYFVIAVNPRHIEFYEAVLFFTRLAAKTVEHYDFVNGAPAVGAYLHLATFYEKLAIAYGYRPDHQNLFKLFMGEPLPNFLFPKRAYHTICDPVMTPEMLDHFFNVKTSLFSRLTDREKEILLSLYRHPDYRQVFPPAAPAKDLKNVRTEMRFDVKCRGRVTLLKTDRALEVTVANASFSGLRAIFPEPCHIEGEVRIQVAVGDFDIAELRGYPVWNLDSVHGFRLTAASANWRAFITHLQTTQILIDSAPLKATG